MDSQQCRGIHCCINTTITLPVQVIQHSLPDSRPRLRHVGAEGQILPRDEQHRSMAGTVHNIPHIEDLDAEDSLWRQGEHPHDTVSILKY
jgi:hypothetical protein